MNRTLFWVILVAGFFGIWFSFYRGHPVTAVGTSILCLVFIVLGRRARVRARNADPGATHEPS